MRNTVMTDPIILSKEDSSTTSTEYSSSDQLSIFKNKSVIFEEIASV